MFWPGGTLPWPSMNVDRLRSSSRTTIRSGSSSAADPLSHAARRLATARGEHEHSRHDRHHVAAYGYQVRRHPRSRDAVIRHQDRPSDLLQTCATLIVGLVLARPLARGPRQAPAARAAPGAHGAPARRSQLLRAASEPYVPGRSHLHVDEPRSSSDPAGPGTSTTAC